MSEAAQLPQPDAAYAHLFDTVHARVFFSKLAADYGVAPANDEEAVSLLKLAGTLRTAQADPRIKQASGVTDDRFAQPVNQLGTVLGRFGLDNPVKSAQVNEEAMALKQAAAQLANDAIYNCVLSVKAAQAQQMVAAA